MLNDSDRIRKLLPHWMEHNAEHAQEFRDWAERVRALGDDDAAEAIVRAAEAMEQANRHLGAAQTSLQP